MMLNPKGIMVTRSQVMILIAALFLTAGSAGAASIRVSWDPRTVVPGAVVALHVQSPRKLLAAEASVATQRFPLIHLQEGEYLALVGIDMNGEISTLPVNFALFPAGGGPPYRLHTDLKIMRTGFAPEEQSLSLPTGMVDFSARRLQQINRDNEMLSEALVMTARQRFWSEGFLLPVKGRITTRFGTRRILNGKPRSPHNGVDIAGGKGSPVKASNSGKVVLADSFYLSGRTVVVDHGWGVSTIYAHLDRIDVSEGQRVKRGQPLGTVGSTGRATGPHLHFGALIRSVKVDPLRLIEVTEGISGGSEVP
jgi:murein DD-endopeptidase MepM/ murein hydrolase activator NlpD